jgi:uncharacterized DUF497 family protein
MIVWDDSKNRANRERHGLGVGSMRKANAREKAIYRQRLAEG